MIILFGRGILGSVVYRIFTKMGANVYRVSRDMIDFVKATPQEFVDLFTSVGRPGTHVINAAAYTDVSNAEHDHLECFRINAMAVETISRACHDAGYRLLHISSNFVFDGSKATPYVETDEEKPISTYGLSKWLGEKFILASNRTAIVLRTGYLYNAEKGLIPGMARAMAEHEVFNAVGDQYIAPTSATDLAKQLWLLTKHPDLPGGIYHAGCHGMTTPYAMAWKIAQRYNLKTTIERTSMAAFYKNQAPRPVMGVLENAKLKACGMDIMADWEDAFLECVP